MAQTPDKAKPYWEYVRTESGVFSYDANGCYQPTVHKAQEGLVEITVTKCFHPNDKKPVRTRLKFEWTKPKSIIYVGEPFDYKLTANLIENSDPEWVIRGAIWMRPEIGKDDAFNRPFPGWAGGAAASLGKGSPNVVILDNLKRTNPDKAIAGWNQSDVLRLNFVADHSNRHWWSYIYRYVVPSQKNMDANLDKVSGIWKVIEKDSKDGQYWEALWKVKDDGRSFDGHWKHFPGEQEGDLPNFARIRSISNNQIIVDRPGFGSYYGTISADGKKINGTISWCQTCTWNVILQKPLPQKLR